MNFPCWEGTLFVRLAWARATDHGGRARRHHARSGTRTATRRGAGIIRRRAVDRRLLRTSIVRAAEQPVAPAAARRAQQNRYSRQDEQLLHESNLPSKRIRSIVGLSPVNSTTQRMMCKRNGRVFSASPVFRSASSEERGQAPRRNRFSRGPGCTRAEPVPILRRCLFFATARVDLG
jgi:hypothetical protein